MVSKWEIYFASLDPTAGSEQKGMRPVLVNSTDSVNHHLPVSTVLPLSSMKAGDKTYPTEIILNCNATGLPKVSVAMLQQIRTIPHNRLTKLAGRITDTQIQAKILDACRCYLDL
jgi:mRNA interferase MazF